MSTVLPSTAPCAGRQAWPTARGCAMLRCTSRGHRGALADLYGRKASILPPMNLEESLEVTRIYSVRGLLPLM